MTACPSILGAGMVNPAFFVAGIFLAAIPIIIHILNRRRFKTVNWAAMEFLLRAMRKNRRRLRFEQWLLLAVRCFVLGLLGLALARPLGCNQTTLAHLAGQRTGLQVLIIDNSYSMAYEADRPDAKTNFDQAKILAKGVIDRLSAGGESVAIITAGRPATAIIAKPAYDLQAAKESIDRIEQSYGGTDLAGALHKALDLGREESRQPNKALYLFSDATRGGWDQSNPTDLADTGREVAKLYRVTHYNLSKPNQWNEAVVDLRPATNLVRSQFNTDVTALARGFGSGAPEAQLQWKLDDRPLSGNAAMLHLAPDTPWQTNSLTQLKEGGLHVLTVSLANGDRLKVDDTRSRVIEVASDLKVLIVEGERGAGALASSGAFLQLALAPPEDQSGPTSAPASATGRPHTASYVAPELISDLELGNKILADYRVVILAGVGSIQPGQADQLRKFVGQGGTLMLFMGDAVSGDNYNATLLPRGLLPGPLTKRMSATGDLGGFHFDFNPEGNLHPFLSIFRSVPTSGLGTAQVFTYWQAEVPPTAKVERVLSYLPADGTTRPAAGTAEDPAITVHDVDRGRVVFISTTANADWTSFPAKPAYLPLMHELLSGSVNSGDRWMNLSVGEVLEIPPTVRTTAAPTLKDPQQADVPIEQAAAADGTPVYKSRPLRRPGVYSLTTGSRTIPVAVNVPGEEADIRRVDENAMRKALGDIDLTFEADQLPPLAAAAEAGNDYGWSIMLAVLLLVALECLLAMRFGHYKR